MIALSCQLLVYIHTWVFAANGCWTLVHVGPESEFLLIFWMFGTPGLVPLVRITVRNRRHFRHKL